MGTRSYITLKKGTEYRTIYCACDGPRVGANLMDMERPELESLWNIIGKYSGRVELDAIYSERQHSTHNAENRECYNAMRFLMSCTDDLGNSAVRHFKVRPKNQCELNVGGAPVSVYRPSSGPWYDWAVAYIYDLNRNRLYYAVHDHNFKAVPVGTFDELISYCVNTAHRLGCQY